MDELLLEIAANAPTVAILLTWIWAEKKAHKETLVFYRRQLNECNAAIHAALSRHIDAEQVK